MNTIDAVISWVDGYDPRYQQKLRAFCQEQGISQNQAVEPTRIQQHNEIHYCLHALRRFAPWLRTVFLITDQQIPPVVKEMQGTAFGNKIKIIDQNELLNEFNIHTPVFNSLSIEWLMWRIKGLSEHFLYLNDDFFIIRERSPEDFFRNDCLVLRGEWKRQAAQKLSYKIKKNLFAGFSNLEVKPKTNPHRSWQEKSAQLAGFEKQFYLLPHAPFALLKSSFDEYIRQNPEAFRENSRFPFRHSDQISSIPLMTHLNIKNKQVVYETHHSTIMVNGASHDLNKIKSRLNHAKKKDHVAFVCMQSIDQAPLETQEYMLKWLQQQIG
jgi:hypothetical protein